MSWIESHTVLSRHRKIAELAKELRLRKSYIMGHLHALWHAALEQQEDGDLSKWTDEFIAESSDFPGDAPQWVRLLQKHGWLDGKVIHDWLDYAGRYLTKRYSTSDVEWLKKIWAIHGKEYGVNAKRTNSDQLATEQRPDSDPTLDNHTKPNPPNHNNNPRAPALAVEIPEDLIPNEPEIREWLAYKREKGQKYKPRGLAALWAMLRAIPPGNRKGAIDHSMGNNWAGIYEKNGGMNASPQAPKRLPAPAAADSGYVPTKKPIIG